MAEQCLKLDEVLTLLHRLKIEHGGKIRIYYEDIKDIEMPVLQLIVKPLGNKQGIYLPKRIVFGG